MNDFAKFSEYGLIGLIIGILFFILWRILIWVMAFIKDMSKQHNEERQIWNGSLNKHNEIIIKISESIDEHDKRADERGAHVRTEHEKMINSLDEIGKTLVRINGYKE